MKKQTQSLFNKISNTTIENLSTATEETLAKGFNNGQPRTFSAVDLWNIHRQRKTFVVR